MPAAPAVEQNTSRSSLAVLMKGKRRQRTSLDQKRILESYYGRSTKPSATEKEAMALQLGMTPRRVTIWFQNRRARDKREGRVPRSQVPGWDNLTSRQLAGAAQGIVDVIEV